jgi:hypothetical protein
MENAAVYLLRELEVLSGLLLAVPGTPNPTPDKVLEAVMDA